MKRILVVDDSPVAMRMIEAALDSAGYQPVPVNDPLQVEPVAAAQRPSLILLDVVMPVKNGFQVCRDLKQNPDTRDIPVLVVTSKNSESDRYWALQQGADGYVAKPFAVPDLLAEVSRLIR